MHDAYYEYMVICIEAVHTTVLPRGALPTYGVDHVQNIVEDSCFRLPPIEAMFSSIS